MCTGADIGDGCLNCLLFLDMYCPAKMHFLVKGAYFGRVKVVDYSAGRELTSDWFLNSFIVVVCGKYFCQVRSEILYPGRD